MFRKLLATTALVTFVAAPALAQNKPDAAHSTSNSAVYMLQIDTLANQGTSGFLASNMLGKTVYASAAEDAESVGEIDDIVIGENGQITAVIIGVGGFLGMGEKDVAVDFDRLSMNKLGENEIRVVAELSREELETAQAYERPDYIADWRSYRGDEPRQSAELKQDEQPVMQSETAATAEQTETEAAVTTTAQTDTANQPAITTDTRNTLTTEATDPQAKRERWLEGKTQVQAGSISAEKLIGATVYGSDSDSVGEIGDIVLTQDGKIDAAVVDVGGFLGMGEKPVAVGFDKVEIYRDEGGELYVLTPYTEDQLESVQAYDEDSYEENRETMRLVTTAQ